jgi:hypothetical protein
MNYIYDRGGDRPDKRKGVKLSMVNKSGNEYQLDGVVETSDGKPVILLESKYLRYKKHNRDKASWTCASHYSLRKSHPTIRKSMAVISGNWSLPSKKFMESFGIELHEISFAHMCKVLANYNIEFDWHEKDTQTPKRSWENFLKLSRIEKEKISEQLINPIKDTLIQSIDVTIKGGEDWAKRLREIELLLKTDRNEYFTYSFHTTREVLQFLLGLQEDAADLRGRL